MRLGFAVGLVAVATVWAVDPTPLDMKTGEWEFTTTMQMTGGMPAGAATQMPTIPPDVLAKMPPDQRAKAEAAMAQAGNMAAGKPMTTTGRNCVNKEDLTNFNPTGTDNRSCKITVVSSSRSHMELKTVCDSPENKSTGTITVDATSPESNKFSVVSQGTVNGRPMNMKVTGTGKWVSATCSK